MDAASSGYALGTDERKGQIWAGEKAEQLAAERAEQRRKDEALHALEKERPGKLRDTRYRKASMDGQQLPSPSESGSSSSPLQTFSPLTPPDSADSISVSISETSTRFSRNADLAVSDSRSSWRTASKATGRTQESRGGARARSATSAAVEGDGANGAAHGSRSRSSTTVNKGGRDRASTGSGRGSKRGSQVGRGKGRGEGRPRGGSTL